MADPTTLLALSGIGVPPYSARGLRQTLEPIHLIAASGGTSPFLRRTVNGALVSLVPPQMLKYRSEITGSDQQPPSFDGLWPGQPITVDCIAELGFPTGGMPQRTVIDGSLYSDLTGFTFYRPRLQMLLADFSAEQDEWGAMAGWKLALEEI